jgi:Holliday junction resolvase RusA-like endonuclease
MKIFIPGNVPSLKNSKQIISIPVKGRPGVKRPMLTSSKRHKQYKKDTAMYWTTLGLGFVKIVKPLPKPLHIHFQFIRGSKHKFDYTNALDTVQDLMTEFGWIDDDNADEILPIIEQYQYDKENPGVFIWVGSLRS